MSRRDEETSAVSLFSFQDLITSITGIMFLVVLMLVLSLLSAHMPDKHTTPSEETARLTDEAAQLQKAVAALQMHNQANDRQLEELRKLSPEELVSRRNRLQEKLKNLLEQHKQQLDNLQQIKSHSAQAEKKLAQLNEMTGKLAESNLRQQKQLAELTQDLKKLQHKYEQQKSLLKYTVDSSSGKTPILLELGSDGILLLDTASMQKLDLRSDSIENSMNNLQSQLTQFDHARHYFSTAVKPGGFIYAGKVLAMLKKSGFERGVEIIPEDSVSLFQEKNL